MNITPEVAASLWLIFLGGVAGSAHCLGMCGPLLLLSESMRSKKWTVWSQIPLHLGRIITYSIMGLLAGFIGVALKKTGLAVGIQGGASLVGGTLMIFFGLSMLGIIKIGFIDKAGSIFPAFITNRFDYSSFAGALLLGMFWGLLPCGLVWAWLLGAATASGSPLGGVATMAAFGLGTVPALLILGGLAGFIGARFRNAMSKAGSVAVILMGLFLLLRGAASAGWIGKIMLAPGVPLY